MNEPIRVLDLFSGIGGFAIAAEIANAMADSARKQDIRQRQGGLHPVASQRRFVGIAHSEIEPFACTVYHKHFPDSVCFGGVENVTRDALIERCGVLPDVVCGGFPCQPHSCAGKRLASEDERDLWGECRRVLGDIRPRFALFENVAGLLTSERGGFFNRVLSDLAALRYACQWQVVPASAVGAPHRRDRVWLLCLDELADGAQGGRGELWQSSGDRGQPDGGGTVLADSDQAGRGELRGAEPTGTQQRPAECGCLAWPALAGQWPSRPVEPQHGWEPRRTLAHRLCDRRQAGRSPVSESTSWRTQFDNSGGAATEPNLGGILDGLPIVVDAAINRVSRLKALGNAIVPQVAAVFMLAILRAAQKARIS